MIEIKYFFAAFFLLIFSHGFSQVKVIKDASSDEYIAGVHVFRKGSNFGVVSNAQGMVNLAAFTKSDTLVFSHVAYSTFEITGNSVDTIIYLEPKAYMLSEVTVPDQSASELLFEAVDSQKSQNADQDFKAYYREYVKVDELFTKYADGDLAYQLEYKEKKEAYDITPYVIQSRKFELESDEQVDLDMVSQVDISVLLSYNSLKSLGRFLDASNAEKYDFSYVNSGIKGMYKLQVTPKPEVGELLYQAEILIDEATGFIHEIDYQTDSNSIAYAREVKIFGMSAKMINRHGVLRFIQVDGRNYLHYSNVSISISVKSKRVDQTITFLSEVMVYSNKLDLESNVKPYKHKSLFKGDGVHHSNFWENGYTTPLVQEYAEVLSKLEQQVK